MRQGLPFGIALDSRTVMVQGITLVSGKYDDFVEKTFGEVFSLRKQGLESFDGFDGIGRAIWNALLACESPERIVDWIASAYQVESEEAQREADEFVTDMVGVGSR
jgi:hypothetical protein